MTGPFGHGIDRMSHGHWPLGQVMGIDRSQKDSWQKDDRVMHDRPLRSGQVTITVSVTVMPVLSMRSNIIPLRLYVLYSNMSLDSLSTVRACAILSHFH